MTAGTIWSKGQITIPADVRHALQVDTGDRVEFVEMAPGRYEFVSATRSVTELEGMFGKATRTLSVEEMNRAITARGASVRWIG